MPSRRLAVLALLCVPCAPLLSQNTPERDPRPDLPPWDSPLWRPIPMPRPAAGDGRAAHYDYAIVHDVASGTTTRVATPPLLDTTVLPGSGDRGRSHPEAGLVGVDTLGELAPVGIPDGYPWRFNARFTIQVGTGYGYGSAAMIDPYHAITAAHAVYDPAWGGFPTAAYVMPAFDSGAVPYGIAKAVSYMVWPGWYIDRDHEHDIAIVRLDRPVGALTGWFGIGEFSSCALYTSTMWFNLGYPAEPPYDGSIMYYQFGQFDSCPSPTESRYLARSWRGQSGSAFWTPFGGDRVAFGVLSHGVSGASPYTDVVRFDPGKLADATMFLEGARPLRYDLTPLDLEVPPALVYRGTFVPNVSVLIHNHSKSAYQGSVTGRVRLSRNRVIDQNDYYTSYVVKNVNLQPLEAQRITFDMWVTTAVTPGFYYVGLELLNADGNPGNQVTMPDDVDQVLVW